MGDGGSIVVDAELVAATKKRPRVGDGEGRDLKRVAEIVMVLAGMGRMRGGNDPTDFEKGLVAEAREKLTEMCASLKPNDLFTSDAARVVAGDLGFNSVKDSVGNRATKRMSIAEKMTLTKKKMEEIKVVPAQPPQPPAPFQPVGSAVKMDNRAASFHGSDRLFPDKQSQTPMSTNSVFATVSPLTHASTISSSSVKQSIFTETPLRPSNCSSLPTAVRGDMGHLRPDGWPSGQYYASNVQGNRVLEKNSAIYPESSVSTAITKPIQVKLADHATSKFESAPAVNSFQTSKQEFNDQGPKSSSVHPIHGSTYGFHQPYHVVDVTQSPSPTVVHSDIARTIQKFLQPKSTEVSNWAPSSVDYMKKPLNCQVCKNGITDLENLLVCDACEKGVHLRCLKSFNQRAVSNIEWHCPKCLLSSNGKLLPPKYGRVTRNIGIPKGSSSADGTHVSSEKRIEHSDSKASNQKVMVNSNPNSVSNQKMTVCPHPSSSNPTCAHPEVDGHVQPTPGKNALDAEGARSKNSSHCDQHKVDILNKASDYVPSKEKISSADTDYDALHDSSIQCMENSKSGSCTMSTPILGSSNEQKVELTPNSVELHTASAEIHPESCDQSIVMVDGDESDIVLHKTVSENTYQENEFTVEETKVPQFRNVNNSNNVIQNGIMAEVPRELASENIHQEIDTYANDETKEPCEPVKASDSNIVSEVVQESQGDSHVATVDIVAESSNHEEPRSAYLHGVDWVGDVLETMDKKTYYQSCCINGLVYKLQDTVMASINHRVFPSKLQALWEDNGNGLKWATLTRFYFPSDLPEVIIRPSTMESDEVYESNDSIAVEASCIHGQCVVLAFSKFQEESGRRATLKERENSLDPVFLCRWFYDKSKSFFQPVTD